MEIDKQKNFLKEKALNLPKNPGVYIMKDSENNIIYVGKAKNLQNRVSQYFNKTSNHTEKVEKMVENICNFEYIITNSEYEALLLECNLIKKHLPKYNILLKDDKGYGYISISNEKWPKIAISRDKTKEKYKYIGPFTNIWQLKEVFKETTKIFKLPTCRRNFDKKSKPCLNYYINQCSAPCAGKISLNSYICDVKDAVSFLEHNDKFTLQSMKKDMLEASNNLEFEKAAKIRDRIKAVENIKTKQTIILNNHIDCDFIAFCNDETIISMNVLKFENGKLYHSENFVVNMEESIEDTKSELIRSYYILRDRPVQKIFLESKISDIDNITKWLCEKYGKNVKIEIPIIGKKLDIIKMCKKNAIESLTKSSLNKNQNIRNLVDLKNILSLKEIPKHIEAYDISNIGGSNNVGGLVVYKNGAPAKKLYKKFKIKTVAGQDDYSSMVEIIERRFLRYLKSDKNSSFAILPDLIFIDGGVEHTKKVRNYINTHLKINVPVFGMVKDDKHRTRALTDDMCEINIKHNKNLFKFITNIQDEVHRYTISYHKKKRELALKNSKLLNINGIGEKRAKTIIKRFKSIDRIAHSSVEELSSIPGITRSIAQSILEYFNSPPES